MATGLHEIYLAIGTLTNEVKNLAEKIDKAEENAAEDTKRADTHRATIHRRVDELVRDVSNVKADVATITKDVADTKSVTDDVKRWKLMGVGALFVTGIAASAIASAVTYFWSDILRVIRGL